MGIGPDLVERRIVTILFADLVGFTSLSEGLDPEDIATVQETYFDSIRDAIARYGGQLEKFIGDAAMAVFGIPAARDDDMDRAVRAALAIVSGVGQIGVSLGLDEDVLQVRVGVNTGEVAHTSFASGGWRATGDTVNVAARLQTAAPPGGVLVGPTTALGVADAFELRATAPLNLKGKAEPFQAWLAVAGFDQPSRDHAMGSLHAPMLGREQELTTLLGALGRVELGAGERWTVVAPPGVGKTRLSDELAASARDRGAAILRARLRPDLLAPYAGVGQLLLTAMRDAEPPVELELDRVVEAGAQLLRHRLVEGGSSVVRADVVVEEVLTILSAQGSLPGAGSVDPEERRAAMFDSWLDAFVALAGTPQLWIVEDVHWSGPDILAFLDAAGSREGRLVVCTARPSIRDAAPTWLAANHATALDLPALSGHDTVRLIEQLVGSAIAPERSSAIAERSDGNPLFVEELLRTWIGTGVLVADGDGWRLNDAATEIRLPATVQAIYAAQLDDLPQDARTVARTGSVAGRRFPVDALASLGAGGARDTGIDALGRRALIAGPTADPLVGGTYGFRHVLLRDAGYASLSRADRSRLHVRFARWLEAATVGRHAELAEVIGVHLEHALESAPALASEIDGSSRPEIRALAARWLETAAREAIAIAAFDAARSLFARSLAMTPDDAPLLRARRLQALGQATAFGADMDDGLANVQEAMAIYRSLMTATDVDASEVRDGYTRAATLVGQVYGQQLRFHDMVELADRVLDDVGDRNDVATGRMLVTRALGRGMISDAAIEADRASVDRALAIARAEGDGDLELDALGLQASNIDEFRALEGVALEHRRWEVAIKAARTQGSLLLPDHAEESLQTADRVAALAEGRGFTEEIAWDDYLRAECAMVTGDWELAWDAGVRAIDLGERNAYHRAVVRTWAVLVLLADACGRTDILERARGWFVVNEGIFPDSPFGRLLKAAASIAIERGGLEPISSSTPSWLEDSIEALWEQLPSWFGAVEIVLERWLELGDVAAARAWLDRYQAAEWPERPPALGRSVRSLLESRMELSEGADPSGVAREALALAREVEAPWWIAKALGVLERADRATVEEVEELRTIEQRLGLKDA